MDEGLEVLIEEKKKILERFSLRKANRLGLMKRLHRALRVEQRLSQKNHKPKDEIIV